MGNMSYCRFENTFHDLEDCAQAIERGAEGYPSSKSELSYRTKLIQLCRDIVEQTEGEDDEEEDSRFGDDLQEDLDRSRGKLDDSDDDRPFPGEGQDGDE